MTFTAVSSDLNYKISDQGLFNRELVLSKSGRMQLKKGVAILSYDF